MGSKPFALALGLRAILVAALGFGTLWLALERHLYATAAVTAGLGVLVVFDIVRQVNAADRLLARFIDGLMVEGDDRPAAAAGMPQLNAAVGRALGRVGAQRADRQKRIDYLQTLADTVAAALLVIDKEGAVEVANQSARRILQNVRRLSDLGETAAQRLASARPGVGEVIRLADGRAVFAMVTGFSTPDGGARRLVSLQRMAGDLDAVELRAWEDLVRVLSHEIMNSLTPILSLAQSGAALVAEPPEAAEALAIIARRSEGLMTFVERYREVFDIPVPERRAMPLGEIVARVGRLMESQIEEAGAALVVRCGAPKIPLLVDPALMDQALINLLKNALEAVRGTPGAAVSLHAGVEDGRVVIEVADNGPGLAPEDVESAFVPFFTRKATGSGVGLSVARRIALAHEGTLEYRRGRDGGAVFRLTLPAAS